jgi:hypothetical protein
VTRDDEGGLRLELVGFDNEFDAVQLWHEVVGHDLDHINIGQGGECIQGPRKSVDWAREAVGEQLGQQIGVGFFVIKNDNGFVGGSAHG